MSILLLLAFAIVILLIVAVIGFVVIRLRRDRLASEERILRESRDACLEEQRQEIKLRENCLKAAQESCPEAIKTLASQASTQKLTYDAKHSSETPGISLKLRGK